MEKENTMSMYILVFLLTISYFMPVCINGEGHQNDAGYLSVSSDNIILYRIILMEKDNKMLVDMLVFLLTKPYGACMYSMVLNILVFLLTISSCPCVY